MLSIFVVILFINAILALPSPRPSQILTEPSVSISNISVVRRTPEVNHGRARHPIQTARQNAPPKVARASLKTRQEILDEIFTVPMTCSQDNCTVSVGIGNPPARLYNLLVDTGMANILIKEAGFIPTSSTITTGRTVSVSAINDSVLSIEVLDTFTLSDNLVVQNQSFALASDFSGAEGVDGILGIGPHNLNVGSVPGFIVTNTLTDNLRQQGVISSSIVSYLAKPVGIAGVSTGALSFGGVPDNSDNLNGTITFFPPTTSLAAAPFFSLDMVLTYGGIELTNLPALLFTGNPDIAFPSETFRAYQSATGAVFDRKAQRLKINPKQLAGLLPLDFHFGSTIFSLPPNGQILPRQDIETEDIYLAVTDGKVSTSEGFGPILGNKFMERFVTVYNTNSNTNRTVGMGLTKFTEAVVN